MSAENKTHEQIVAEVRFHAQQNIDAEKDKPEFGILTMEGRIIQNCANELEAAYKRDVEKLNSVIQATVSRSDAETDRLRRERDTLQRERDELAKDYNNAQRERSIANGKLREMEKSVGNAAKMREVYEWAEKNLRDYGGDWELHNKLCDMLKDALSAPARNCDVGTADEQRKRFGAFCKLFYDKVGCEGCPFWTKGRIGNNCELKWAQMPYTESETINVK